MENDKEETESMERMYPKQDYNKNRYIARKLDYFRKKKIQITFRMFNHQEYFITGRVLKVNGDVDNIKLKPFEFEMRLKSGEKAVFFTDDIDSETIIPSKYNPIRYFVREVITEELKNKIFQRDNFKCQLKLEGCAEKAEEIDHIIPISKGGLNNLDNLQASCSNCNRKKNNNLIF